MGAVMLCHRGKSPFGAFPKANVHIYIERQRHSAKMFPLFWQNVTSVLQMLVLFPVYGYSR